MNEVYYFCIHLFAFSTLTVFQGCGIGGIWVDLRNIFDKEVNLQSFFFYLPSCFYIALY